MRYMVGHNVSHTNELKELAHKLAHTGDSEACAQILDAVQDYETGNQKLAASLDQLQKWTASAKPVGFAYVGLSNVGKTYVG